MTFEYVTSTVSVLANDGIVVHVLNHSLSKEFAHVLVYQNTGAGAVQVVDSGDSEVTPTWQWGLAYTVQDSGEYWVQIQVSSEFLIPKVAFERYDGTAWMPIIAYSPGDFAVFELQRRRLW